MTKKNKKYPKPDRSNYVPNTYKNDPYLPEIDLGFATGSLPDGRPYREELWASEGNTLLTFFFSVIDLDEAKPEEVLIVLLPLLEKSRVPKKFQTLSKDAFHVIKDASDNDMFSLTFIIGLSE